jgi:alkaline phosphatase D
MKLTRALFLILFVAGFQTTDAAGPVYMATGLKVTEVGPTSAAVWTRLTKNPDRNRAGVHFGKKDDKLPPGKAVADMVDSAVGVAGQVRISYRAKVADDSTTLEWKPVISSADFTRHFQLKNLRPGSEYVVKTEGRPGNSGAATVMLHGQFRTPPAKASTGEVSFTVVTGQDYVRRDDPVNGHKIYAQMLKKKPHFFVHTGDVVYYDKALPWAKSEELAHYKWQSTYSLPFQREFHKNVASYFMRDDHDITKNDSWPGINYGDLTWEAGLRIFREQTGLPELPYRTIRWGKDLQIWLPAGRQFRSANTDPDGPGKSIWGKEQKQWFFNSVKKSDATFRIVVNSTPIVGPDRGNKKDNHANVGFTHEGDDIRQFVSTQKNMYLVCGDRHWQYVSVDPKTGVTEYSCGPTSDRHAGGWKQSNVSPMHKYLNVKGGFLRVVVKRVKGKPQVAFQHHSVDGKIYNEDIKRVQ